jgi:hypothetical protein
MRVATEAGQKRAAVPGGSEEKEELTGSSCNLATSVKVKFIEWM